MQENTKKQKSGFTLIEVMLALAVMGAMLIGLVSGTFVSIAQQRYNDSLQDFADYLSGVYDEVLSPITQGAGNSSNQAILGKILVFGYAYGDDDMSVDNRSIYSATIAGTTNFNHNINEPFLDELAHSSVNLVCGEKNGDEIIQKSTMQQYTPLWEAWVNMTGDAKEERFKGTIIVSRTPSSGRVHTAYAEDISFDLKTQCTPDNRTASSLFQDSLTDSEKRKKYNTSDDIKFCVRSDDTSIFREVDVIANGSNSSAVRILNAEQSQCR